MDTKLRLLQYAALKMEALYNEERILQAFNDTQIPAMRQGDGSQRTPGRGDRQENAAIKYMETKDRLQPMIDANREEMRRIEDAISCLTDGMEREVLRLRYIDVRGWKPLSWRRVSIKMYGDDEDKNVHSVQRIHRRAVDSLDAVFAEKEESRL